MSKKYTAVMSIWEPCSSCGALKGKPCQRNGKDLKKIHETRKLGKAENTLNQQVAAHDGMGSMEEHWFWCWCYAGIAHLYTPMPSDEYLDWFFKRYPQVDPRMEEFR